ncbi:MAG: dihydrodipicolinate reductase C-terminal domain-containing protein, partial [Chloroflexota bacterium]
MTTIILGDGGLGRAVADSLRARRDEVRVLGRPNGGRHPVDRFRDVQLAIDATRAPAVAANVAVALRGGCRALVIATTGWDADRPRVEHLLREHEAAAVVAPNFSLGMALFGRLVDAAVDLYGAIPAFDPFIVEWHRRTKPDRPSGTANALAHRILERHPAKRRTTG